jgi:hypothetical protein
MNKKRMNNKAFVHASPCTKNRQPRKTRLHRDAIFNKDHSEVTGRDVGKSWGEKGAEGQFMM